MVSEEKRGAFSHALRRWRGQRGLSQIELALAAETTQRYVSFIESGRSLPGRGMVIRLGEALDLPLRERNALLLAAGYAPAYRETSFDDPKLGPVRRALDRILEGHLPYPAVVVDRHGDLVAGNEAFWGLTDGVAPELLTTPVNIPRVLLHPKGMAPRIINPDAWAWHVIDALSREEDINPARAARRWSLGSRPSFRSGRPRRPPITWASPYPFGFAHGRASFSS
jgi:transcriptional regulator with XRE-family HTH domain